MKEFIETERLILRKFHLSDIESLFELDKSLSFVVSIDSKR